MDNIVHNRRYFYSESNETFQSKSDVRVRPTTKAVNEPSGCILDALERGEC